MTIDERRGWAQDHSTSGWDQKLNRAGTESRNIPDTGPPGPAVISVNADVVLGDAPLTVTFTVESNLNYTALYTIDYGDGDTATQTRHLPGGVSFSHTYATPGTYDVTLTCANGFGGVSNTATVQVVAAQPALTPADIGSLLVHYDFTLLGLSDGAAISAVTDLSGNGWDLAQATGSAQPSFQTNELNGLGVAQAADAGDYLRTADGLTLPQPFTMAAVWKPVDANSVVFTDGDLTVVGGAFGSLANPPKPYYTSAGSLGGRAEDPTTSTWHALTAVVNGASSSLYVGSTLIETDTTSGNFQTSARLWVGSGGAMQVAEAVIFSKALSDSERAGLELYFADKYAL